MNIRFRGKSREEFQDAYQVIALKVMLSEGYLHAFDEFFHLPSLS